MDDDSDEPNLYVAIVRYANYRFEQMAESVSESMQGLDATGIFEEESFQNVWEEYRHNLETGLNEFLDEAFESVERPFVMEAVNSLSHEEACLLSLSDPEAEESWSQYDDYLIGQVTSALRQNAMDWVDPREFVMGLAWDSAPACVGINLLVDEVGEAAILEEFGEFLDELTKPSARLQLFAEALADEILLIAHGAGLAPFDGTLKELLDDCQTDEDWLIHEDLLPFLRNWHSNVLKANA